MERRELLTFYDRENQGGGEIEDKTLRKIVYSKRLHINSATGVNLVCN